MRSMKKSSIELNSAAIHTAEQLCGKAASGFFDENIFVDIAHKLGDTISEALDLNMPLTAKWGGAFLWLSC